MISLFIFQIQPLYDSYQRDVEINLWEPINRYWAECYEACKLASKKRSTFQAENRTIFQVSSPETKKICDMQAYSVTITIINNNSNATTTTCIQLYNLIFIFVFPFFLIVRKKLSFLGRCAKLKKRNVWMQLHCSINVKIVTSRKNGNVPNDSCTDLVVPGLRGKWN